MRRAAMGEKTGLAGLIESFGKLRQRVRDLVEDAVGTLAPEIRTPVAYHFGFQDLDGRPADGSSGKMLRPILVCLGSAAVGGEGPESEAVVTAAAAVELVHNFSLVHDDLMDRDDMRHSRPTVWKSFGEASAILAGDAMLALALSLLESAPGLRAEAGSVLLRGVSEMIAGQALDIELSKRQSVALEEVLYMSRLKTGALFAASLALGALASAAEPHAVEALRSFGYSLGVAFQITDDILGIWGDPLVTGKPVYSDIIERKKTVPIVLGLEQGDDELAALLASPRMNLHVAGLVVERLDSAECRQRAESLAIELLSSSLSELEIAGKGAVSGELLREFAGTLVGREF
jgi:geranylgeranyl diphosphate synthase type I